MRTELRSGLGARCAQAGQGKGHLLPAPGTGALGMGSESGGSHGGLCQPPACPHLPSKAAQRMGGEPSPQEKPRVQHQCLTVICALSALPLKTILTAFQGTPQPPRNIWSSVNKRAWREPQSLNTYIHIRHRNAMLTFSW